MTFVRKIVLLYILLLYIIYTDAQHLLSISNPTYTQNFNLLPSTGTSTTWTDNSTLTSWYSDKNLIYTTDGTTPTTISLSSYGSTSNTERALGAQGGLGTTYFALRLKNDDATQNITSLDVVFTGEQWREGTIAGTLNFEYQVANAGAITDANSPTTGWSAVTSLDFTDIVHTTAQALNGNLSSNQSNKSNAISLTATPGQEIWIRWKFVGGSGARCGLGIDNITVTANYPGGCSAPSTAPSALTFTSLTPYFYDVGWTNGNGAARLLLGKQTNPIVDPPQNGNYSIIQNSTWTQYPLNEMPPAGSNIRVLYDGTGNTINISALQPETQYCFSIYEYNGSHCYNMNELNGCRYTLSLEPTVNSNILTAQNINSTQLGLTFQSMNSAGLPSLNYGYIIIQKTNGIPTDVPIDGGAYTVGNTIGSSTVAAIITDPNQTAITISSLSSGNQYCYKIYSFRWNGSSSETYNYLTSGIIPNSCDIVLPVELISFSASCFDAQTNLQWKTASEKNSKLFNIEKSIDAINFYVIGTVLASGYSTQLKEYTFIDSSNSSNAYYRLTYFDDDYTMNRSKIILSRCNNEHESIEVFYQNLSNSIIIKTNLPIATQSAILIYDESGKLLHYEKIQFESDKFHFINLANKLSKGIYIVSIKSAASVMSRKIFIE